MKRKISIEEIEEIIKKKLSQKGILDVVGNEKISEIKNKIKEILENGKKLEEQDDADLNKKIEKPVETTTSPRNPNITVSTTEDKEKTEMIEKVKELEMKENDLIKKELELEEKERQLKSKEQELSYKPELPQILKSVKPGEVIIFDENELSFGLENLSQRDFRLKNDPDSKKSIKDLWLSNGITKTDVYKVELRKIGELDFNPYDGTTAFVEKTITDQISNLNNDNQRDHDVESAIKSQFPEKEMEDSIQPIKDVSQPILNTDDLQKQKFETNFKDVITKIVSDELNRISSETTKQNIFSL